MKEYTEKLHAERLIKILNKKDTCNRCPATKWFRGTSNAAEQGYINKPCEICQKFVGLKLNKDRYKHSCPCYRLSKERAIEKSWLALEKRGYLAK